MDDLQMTYLSLVCVASSATTNFCNSFLQACIRNNPSRLAVASPTNSTRVSELPLKVPSAVLTTHLYRAQPELPHKYLRKNLPPSRCGLFTWETYAASPAASYEVVRDMCHRDARLVPRGNWSAVHAQVGSEIHGA